MWHFTINFPSNEFQGQMKSNQLTNNLVWSDENEDDCDDKLFTSLPGDIIQPNQHCCPSKGIGAAFQENINQASRFFQNLSLASRSCQSFDWYWTCCCSVGCRCFPTTKTSGKSLHLWLGWCQGQDNDNCVLAELGHCGGTAALTLLWQVDLGI